MNTTSDTLKMDRNQLASNMHNILIKCDNSCQQHFVSVYKKEIEDFISYTITALLLWNKCHSQEIKGKINKGVSLFCLCSINYLFKAFHLLVSGYVIPSGNMNRHVIESISMAFLSAIPNLNIYDEFLDEKFSSRKAVYLLKKKINKLKKNMPLYSDAFEQMINWYKSYSSLSHLSPIELRLVRSDKSYFTLGPHYNTELSNLYNKELKRMLSLVKIYDNLFATIELLNSSGSQS